MCEATGCPLKKKCYRYTAPKSEYGQAYFAEVPYDEENKSCEHFWDNTGRKVSNSQFAIRK